MNSNSLEKQLVIEPVLSEFGLFHQPPNDNNIYHVTLQQISENVVLEDFYDYEFFYQNSNTIYYVKCKLLSHSLIVNLLNKEIYGEDFDKNDLRCKYILTLDQKLNLESSLKEALPFVQDQILKSDLRIEASDMNINSSDSTQAMTINSIQNYQPTQRLFYYQQPNDDNFYHITYKMILKDYLQTYDDDYDYEFFHHSSIARYHVTCKSLSHSSIINKLNKIIYGKDFLNENKCVLLTSQQKFNLELNLKQILPLYYVHDESSMAQIVSMRPLEDVPYLEKIRGVIQKYIVKTDEFSGTLLWVSV
ncbi:hypothetical protein C1645_815026 [Glomus cerebriforme]|uniref:Uncharacterized protein n=1 Tax=Glomus cerebriforme TaxID=658196 RepID=A0A397TFN1_9GLOM|nr:hypothetical protein C1645_815026 [Glomus cerebriforme]